jgi:Uma2 family endonuclease
MVAVIRGPHIAVSDEDLHDLSEANPGWRFERADDGALLVSPTSTSGGARSGEAFAQLYAYAKRAGGKAFDAATGFRTPGGGVVSPDASWVAAERVALHANDTGYWSLIPDVAVEIASPSDSWAALTRKIDKYLADGARYAIAIDPQSHEVYERGRRPDGLALDVAAIIAA